jgi:hypothetical protein
VSEASRDSTATDELPALPTRRLSIGTVPLSTLGLTTEDPQALRQDGVPPPRRLSLANVVRRRSMFPGAGPDEEAPAADPKASTSLPLGTAPPGLFGILRRPSAAIVVEEFPEPPEAALPEVGYHRPVTTIVEEQDTGMDTIQEGDEDEAAAAQSPKPDGSA